LAKSSRRVVTTGMPRIAAADAPNAAQQAANRPIFSHGFHEIDAATRLKAAVPAQQRADEPTIELHGRDQKPAGQSPKRSAHPSDCLAEIFHTAILRQKLNFGKMCKIYGILVLRRRPVAATIPPPHVFRNMERKTGANAGLAFSATSWLGADLSVWQEQLGKMDFASRPGGSRWSRCM
jgi:hypothetical protein